MAKHNTPIIREERAPTRDRDPLQSFLSSRLARVGAAATGAALLATRLTGMAAAYDDGSKAFAVDDQGGSYWYDVADKDDKKGGGNAPAKPADQPKNDDAAGQKKAESPQEPAKPSEPPGQTKQQDEAPKPQAHPAAQQPAATTQQSAPAEQPKNETKNESKPTNENKPQNETGGGNQAGGQSTTTETGKHVPTVSDENTRGKSNSNPDGSTATGVGQGVDKPYDVGDHKAGGQSYDADPKDSYHDGNNGCGQDKHSGEARETDTRHTGFDDNNGWCGKERVAGETAVPSPTPEDTPEETPVETPVETPEETPVETPEETPVETPEETPVPDDTPEDEPTVVGGETEVPNDTPVPDDTSVPDSTPVPDDTPEDEPTIVGGETAIPTTEASPTPCPTGMEDDDDTTGTNDTAGTGATSCIPPTSSDNAEQPTSAGDRNNPGPALTDVQPGDLSQPEAAKVAEIIGGGLAPSDVRNMGGEEIAALAEAAGVPVADVEAVLGESVSRDVPGEVWIEDVLGTQARQGYENVVAGAMASTGGAPVGPIALGLAALGGVGLAFRRFTKRSI